MGAPVSKIEATENKTAEELLSAFKHMAPAERRKHATVYNYWLSIRRDRDLPPIRDLDALEISDAAPCGVLLELVDGGDDAEILHAGETLRGDVQVKRLSEAPDPSVLSCIACKLGIIAISRDALAFEDHFVGSDGTTRCCVTLLPFSMTGDAVDFVYGLVSVETGVTFAEGTAEADAGDAEQAEEPAADEVQPVAEATVQDEESVADDEPAAAEAAEPIIENEPTEPVADVALVPEDINEQPDTVEAESDGDEAPAKPGFSKIFDALSGAKGFFGTVAPSETGPAPDAVMPAEPELVPEPVVPTEPDLPPIPVAEEEPASIAEEPAPEIDEDVEEPAAALEEPTPIAAEVQQPAPIAEETVETPVYATEGTLQSKLTEVRSKADEARMARQRSEALLVEGLSAAYDFALDAENEPEEYLKLVEAQGLKIQLRSPMKPVVKLAFDGYCDELTIKELEAVLAWALKSDLPRGTLAERIEAEGGIDAIANGQKTRRSTDG